MVETPNTGAMAMNLTNDRGTELLQNFVAGHEYEVVVRAIGPDGTQQPIEEASRNTIVIQGKLSAPDNCTELVATGFLDAISLTWTNPTTYDFDHVEVWRSASNDVDTASKVAVVMVAYYLDPVGSPDLTYYYWVKSVNTSGVEGNLYPYTTAGVSGTSEGVSATDIDDFSISATKMFNRTIILTGDSWTNNSPGAGSIAWNAHSVVYNGTSYPISGSNTSSKYVYWTIGSASYSASATHPTLGTTAFMIAINTSGTHTLVWNNSANMVIGTAFIADLAVTNAKIANTTITNAKISDLSASKLTAGTINASVITVTNLNATNISTGTLTGRTVQTASSGQRIVLDQSDNTLRFHTSTVSDVVVIDDTISGSLPGIRIESTGVGGVVLIREDTNDYAQLSHDSIYIKSSSGDILYGQYNYLKIHGYMDAPLGYYLGGTQLIDSSKNITTNIGTIDGVDLAALKSAYDSHIANADAHHPKSHDLESHSDVQWIGSPANNEVLTNYNGSYWYNN